MCLRYAARRRLFAAIPRFVGHARIIPHRQQRVRIVGVAPPGFEYPTGADAWDPTPPDFTSQVDIVARLASNVTIKAVCA
jgi:hypothetical protein